MHLKPSPTLLRRWRLHPDLEESTDLMLAGQQPNTQLRHRDAHGRMVVQFETAAAAQRAVDGGAGVGTTGMAAKPFGGAWLVNLVHAAVRLSIEQGL